MNIWLITARTDLPIDDDPWKPWYDKCFGMVIRAETEKRARILADWYSYDESGIETLVFKRKPEFTNAWTDPKYSTCVELKDEGEEKVIMMDVRTA